MGTDWASELVATGITVSEVRVSQGVDDAGLDEGEAGTGTTGTVLGAAEGWGAGLEGRTAGVVVGTTTSTVEPVPVAWTTVVCSSELVATGITVSEVRVSQGVEEGALEDSAAADEGTGMTGTVLLEGAGAGLEGCWAGTEG